VVSESGEIHPGEQSVTHVTATCTVTGDPSPVQVKITQLVPKTVASLYQTNSHIRDLIDFWVQERRCPMGLVDELLIEGMDSAADCALWAATVKDRPVRMPDTTRERDTPCGLYPTTYHDGWAFTSPEYMMHADQVPKGRMPGFYRKEPTIRAVIIWLLDNWVKS